MYIFVRIHAWLTIILGILLILFGLVLAIFSFVQNALMVDWVNTWILAASNLRMVDSRFYAPLVGLLVILLGLAVAAFGELFLVFADVAKNTHETSQFISRMRKSDDNPVVYSTLQPVIVQPAPAAPIEVRFTGAQSAQPVILQPVPASPDELNKLTGLQTAEPAPSPVTPAA